MTVCCCSYCHNCCCMMCCHGGYPLLLALLLLRRDTLTVMCDIVMYMYRHCEFVMYTFIDVPVL